MKKFLILPAVFIAAFCFGCSSTQQTEAEADGVISEEQVISVKPAEQPYVYDTESQVKEETAVVDNDVSNEFSESEDENYYYYRVGSFRNSGDCLASIARKYYNNTNKWHQIYDANREQLSSPDVIKQGMLIKVPKE